MSNPPEDAAAASRGARRRTQLVGAGLELLTERGWSAVTARAVAQRAGTHPALLHHHFGGLPGFRLAVAEAAVREAFDPAVAALTAAASWPAGLAAVVRRAHRDSDPATARIGTELVAAAVEDTEVADLMDRTLADTRARLVPWLAGQGARHPEGLATLLVALLDGLLLHRLVDPALDLLQVADAAEALGEVGPSPAAVRPGRAR